MCVYIERDRDASISIYPFESVFRGRGNCWESTHSHCQHRHVLKRWSSVGQISVKQVKGMTSRGRVIPSRESCWLRHSMDPVGKPTTRSSSLSISKYTVYPKIALPTRNVYRLSTVQNYPNGFFFFVQQSFGLVLSAFYFLLGKARCWIFGWHSTMRCLLPWLASYRSPFLLEITLLLTNSTQHQKSFHIILEWFVFVFLQNLKIWKRRWRGRPNGCPVLVGFGREDCERVSRRRHYAMSMTSKAGPNRRHLTAAHDNNKICIKKPNKKTTQTSIKIKSLWQTHKQNKTNKKIVK